MRNRDVTRIRVGHQIPSGRVGQSRLNDHVERAGEDVHVADLVGVVAVISFLAIISFSGDTTR